MAFVQRAMVFFLVMAALESSLAAVYKVGDSAGWTIIGNVDYTAWAANKNFRIGDTIVFEYNKQFHNVMQVSHPAFQACNASSPIATHASGNDSISVTRHGHYYFLCGVPGHCQAGQKVDIRIPRASAMAPSPSGGTSSSSSSSTSPSSSSASGATAPGPSKNSAPRPSSWLLGKIGQALAIFAVFVYGFTY